MELWGGLECTVNRIGDEFRDQLHGLSDARHIDAVDRLIDLGLKAVRYPVLWERVAPTDPARPDWSLYDRPLERLRSGGVRVIAGLVHHGSGPGYTSLLDDEGFARGLARHAALAAQRYPWVTDWTPVNEPVTTARFSCLYGHWYPHERDERQFWRALLNQIDGVRLSMAAIREVTPDARLIQTEDLGRTFATSEVRGTAAFYNLRRWAGWDLLCGRVTRHHPLFGYLARFGFEDRLHAIADAPCPPDIMGINHYLTSDRFLDHRLGRYPTHIHGANASHPYVDVEAIRVLDPAPPGLRGAITETWERYGLPIAVTEVHNGCTREEQLRWTAQAWDVAEALRTRGVDIRAVTAWALFGSRGWNTLLTGDGIYEPGAFDTSGGSPRPTAIADLLRALAGNGSRHPLAALPGWWDRPIRFRHPVVHRPAAAREHQAPGERPAPACPPLMVLGGRGTLGEGFVGACALRNIPVVQPGRGSVDIRDPASIDDALDQHRPWAVVNATGWADVERAERDPEGCFAINTTAAIALARACAARGIPTLSFSSDQVFDGEADTPYHEGSARAPLNALGRSKAAMEDGLAALSGRHLVIRTAALFTPYTDHNLGADIVRRLYAGQPVEGAPRTVVTPTYVPHLVCAALDLLIDGETGLWHLTNGEPLELAAFARMLGASLGLQVPASCLPAERQNASAPRPAYAAVVTRRGAALPPLGDAVAAFAAELANRPALRAAAG